jgi:diacylglycerol kinase
MAFKYAFSGLWYVIKTQKNAWVHAIATILVICISYWLSLESRDWAIIVITIGMVWTAEIINTALEAIVDLASPQQHPLAKVGKDVGAASVLIAAIASAIIGLLILGPPLLQKIKSLGF